MENHTDEKESEYDELRKEIFSTLSKNETKALESITFWRGLMIKSFSEVDFHDPRRIEENAQIIGDDTLENMALVISNTEEGIKRLQKYVQLGFTEIVVVNPSPDRKKLVKLLAQQISPAVEAEQ